MMYSIPAGANCLVRRIGTLDWQPYRTTKINQFHHRRIEDNGGYWLFQQSGGGWELKILPVLVRRQKPNKKKRPRGSFGTTRGKGASRRRNQRATKRKH